MNWIVYLFGSGAVFFLGVALLFVSLAAFIASRRRWLQFGASVLVIVGCLLVALSATPLPYWLYVVAGIMTLLWLASERSEAGLSSLVANCSAGRPFFGSAPAQASCRITSHPGRLPTGIRRCT